MNFGKGAYVGAVVGLGLASSLFVLTMSRGVAVRDISEESERGEFEPSKLEQQQFIDWLRTFPGKTIDLAAYRKASFVPKTGTPEGGSDWTYIGPDDMPGSGGLYNGPGQVSGRVNDIAISPADPADIVICAPTGGVHESTDGGDNWTPLSDDWPFMFTSCAAFKPNNSNILLVGMGDYHGFERLGPIGIMKGVRSGGNWAWTNTGQADFANTTVSQVVFDPENPNIVLASSGRGAGGANAGGQVFRSTNAGDTWTPRLTLSRPWNNVVYGAMNPATGRRIYYAVANGTGNILQRSLDKGLNWRPMAKPTEMTAASQQGVDIAASPTNPDVAYLLSGTDQSIWKTSNGGLKWALIMGPGNRNGFPADDGATTGYNFSQAYYDWHIACGTHVDLFTFAQFDDIYVGLITLAHSPDGGATWVDEGHTYAGEVVGANTLYYTHNDQHCLTFVPGQGDQMLEMWVGNDGGLYKTTMNLFDLRLSLDPAKNKRLYIAEFYHASWDVQTPDPSNVLGGTQDQGSPWADSGTWKQNRVLGDGIGAWIGRGAANGEQKQFTNRIATGTGFNFLSTSSKWGTEYNDALTFTEPWAQFSPLAGDPNTPSIVYSASNRLWQYDVSRVNANINTTVTAGAVGATQTVGSTAGMYEGQVLLFNDTGVNALGVYYTIVSSITNGTTVVLTQGIITNQPATNWQVTSPCEGWMQTKATQALSGSSVFSIAVAKGDGSWILTGGLDGQVWRTTNAGATNAGWTQINTAGLGAGNLPVRPVSDIAINPNDKKQVWVTLTGAATAARVAMCPDVTKATAAREWKQLGGALPAVPVNCIALDPDNPAVNIFVGTDMGMYYSKDGGTTWSHANNIAASRMPSNIKVTDIEVVGTGVSRTVNLSTYGRGIWRVSVVTL